MIAMDNGISVEEACQNRYLSGEDYERLCMEGGIPKFSPTATSTAPTTDTPQAGLRVNDTMIAVGLGVIIFLTVTVALLAWRLLRRQRSSS